MRSTAFDTAPPCRRKANRPPTPAARAEAARLLSIGGDDVVIDLAAYQTLVDAMAHHHHDHVAAVPLAHVAGEDLRRCQGVDGATCSSVSGVIGAPIRRS